MEAIFRSFTHSDNSKGEKMKILVCYDRREETGKIFKVAQMHAKAFNASVVIVTTIAAGSRESAEMEKKAKAVFDTEIANFESANITCEAVILHHGVSEEDELLEFARKNEIDQIILGARKRSKLGKFLIGSVAQHLILGSVCPVLTVPLS
jgi:nucleotide-binding universal stress UspA family protein